MASLSPPTFLYLCTSVAEPTPSPPPPLGGFGMESGDSGSGYTAVLLKKLQFFP